ncbi:MAG TPA: hypothetical protein ENH19_03270 [Actinobacteria bacterium]|nr:hypothetical protein [Actinomycetes bacterium]HEX21657.1 hypothetical protein [Actinomycetota bacterium]
MSELKKQEYKCAGCKHCYAAVTLNALHTLLEAGETSETETESIEANPGWPPFPGDYSVLSHSRNCHIAVSTLASEELAQTLNEMRPAGLSIVGKTETENIGIDKLIKNTITNPALRFLILCGPDPQGHLSGKTILALAQNGIDEKMRIIDSPGRRPVLKNVTPEEIDRFKQQVSIIDMIGSEDALTVARKIEELSESKPRPYDVVSDEINPLYVPSAEKEERIQAKEPTSLKLDKAGYFVIIPESARKMIIVEHYSYDNKLLHTIEGITARTIYFTIIDNGWTSDLYHAAYLGKELEKAELSMKLGFRYEQDGI